MSVKVQKLEKSKVELEVTVEAAEVSKAFVRAAKKAAGQVNIPGFRKGKAPKHIIEKAVGVEYLKEEVLEIIISPTLMKAYDEAEIYPVARPEVDLVQLEDGQDLIYKVIVEVKPEVELGQYTGLEVEEKNVEVTDEDLAKELERRQDRHAKLISIEEGEVLNQDQVNIDYEGFKNGVAFEGGKGESQDLTIGSNTFIPGFEEQLIGAKIGQELEINVRFPDEYHAPDLAGQDAVFKVKINGIKRKELVALDDEFAKDVSEFDTLDELKADMKEKMLSAKKVATEKEMRAEVVKRAVELASVEVPEGMIEGRIDQMIEELKRNLSYQGLSLEQYSQILSTGEASIRENYREQALNGIKGDLVIEEIGKKEGITVTDEEMDQELEKMAMQYGRSVEELKMALLNTGDLSWFKAGLVSEKVLTFLVEKNKVSRAVTEE